MPRPLAPALLVASLALLAACQPPPAATAPATAPAPVGPPPGAPAGAEPAATAADQMEAEPIPGLGD